MTIRHTQTHTHTHLWGVARTIARFADFTPPGACGFRFLRSSLSAAYTRLWRPIPRLPAGPRLCIELWCEQASELSPCHVHIPSRPPPATPSAPQGKAPWMPGAHLCGGAWTLGGACPPGGCHTRIPSVWVFVTLRSQSSRATALTSVPMSPAP